jgi:uncharacterized membrane protein YfcA
MILLVVISFVAAVVNGALGYGFSSIAVPLALLVVGNRVLNPALVLLEIVLNAHMLWLNRQALPHIWRRALLVVVGLAPGVVFGTAVLTHVDPAWLKLATYIGLLPLILLQAVGYRRAIRSERAAGIVLGAGVGGLYAITTISGPPLAMFLNNQGYVKQELRAALGIIRFAEAALTATLYARADLFTTVNVRLFIAILPSVIIGVPVGAMLIRRVREESFRRACISLNAAIVAFGVSTLLRTLHVVDGGWAYLPFAAVLVFIAAVSYRFFQTSSSSIPTCAQPQIP